MIRTTIRLAAGLALVATLLTGPGAGLAHAGTAAIHAHRIAGHLDQPVGFTFTPNGRIFYVEKASGEVRLLNPANDHQRLFFEVSHVLSDAERGTLGIALHPNYPQRPYVFVYASRNVNGRARNQILKLTDVNGHGRHMRVIWSAPAANGYHNGGRILFGPDGMLYAFMGDGHDSSNAQDLTHNDRGKVLRMTPTGRVPDDNPFARRRIYSYGNRNSFGFTFDPQTDVLWETENGPQCNDEINPIYPGENYGWGPNETCRGPQPEGTNQDGPNPILPSLFFSDPIGITGAAFCDGCHLNAASEGDLFFGAVTNGNIYRVDLNMARDDTRNGTLTTVMTASSGSSISLEVDPNGSIYFSDFSAIYKLVYN